MRRAYILIPLLLLASASTRPPGAHAAQSVRLHVAFTPERLGHSTTVDFSAQIAAPAGQVPPPLTQLDVRYPRALSVALGELGLATCAQQRLETLGPAGCPADSRMGQGSALAEIAIGPDILQETAQVAIIRAPEQAGRLALLFFAEGLSPVYAQVTFSGLLLPGPSPAQETVHIDVPLVPSVPGAPNVAVVHLHATLGPRGLTYYEHTHGRTVAYHPRGVLLPSRCPRGGFPFAATFTFEDQTHTTAATTVPCPTKPPTQRN